MNVLIIGSGAREHAFCWKLKESNNCKRIFVAPGNAGTSKIASNLNIDVLNFDQVKSSILKLDINLVMVGPEIPLIEGIVDFINNDIDLKSVLVVGPSKAGAKLEGSKDFSKEFMVKHNIPTAKYESFSSENLDKGLDYLQSISPPYVLKADGPAAGKGVLIIDNLIEAKEELTNMLKNNKFGSSGHNVVIEEFLDGIELSCFVLTDGTSYSILPYAKDYKRIGEGDMGLNTGGMGAISPVPFANKEFLKKVEERIIVPTINGLKSDNLPYKGFVFIGLIMVDNEPYVIEYNVRMGDPETQVVLPRIKTDFLDLMISTAQGSLAEREIEIIDETYSNIVMVAGGYPENYEKGNIITGIPEDTNSTIIFHAGTKHVNNDILTNGGRVLSIVSKGQGHNEAVSKSYKVIEKINYKNKNYRKDIGFDL
ncbi:phosphoribosylamine--glycine ligase [Flavobacteriaceae bacterium]|nr:phosphoribosylamine--glycine ligase [Flavobacteriaceae bacterium]MDB9788058.1 phosphoribosylamine--glycine ligase [Flavobacteriaceae bacterium]MDB9902400.1 phosphoribosylamine--glycine ligase [Flavobacteriaceae bacterium]MDC0958079.1 phosphoribosylamine--glycine ligase [Flavobacteriaceae bacterium]